MSTRTVVAAIGLLVAVAANFSARAEVRVQFVEPEHYADAGERSYGDDRDALDALRRYLESLGERCLREGETLDLRVLDVDLAGRHEWWRHDAYGLRVMRDITWPRLDVEYEWRDAAGRVIGGARERVADMNYLSRSAYVRGDRDPLPYERAMLRDWFERRFCRDRG